MRVALLLTTLFVVALSGHAQPSAPGKPVPFAVIGYYAGRTTMLDSFDVSNKLTHLIFSFCHLKGDKLAITNARDTATLRRIVAFRQQNPNLKIIVSLGGWGGCATCSAVFATDKGRRRFARSTRRLLRRFHCDGIDLDWEYPVISGYPGHRNGPEDRDDFTDLVRRLRKKLGPSKEISFAAGGFDLYIDSSIDWKKVMPLVNRVNLMSYDLVGGYSKVAGHHTPLYSTPAQKESTDNGVQRMIAAGVPADKIAIGAAFYGRLYQVTDTTGNGLYGKGAFYRGVSFSRFEDSISSARGFTRYWDPIAQAPYAFNPVRKLLFTYDDTLSVRLKTRYAYAHKLNGLLFWQLAADAFSTRFLDI
ncbi:MAG: glycoside hydrolase, partial [Bacteroidetes bacterium]|nr:glycoside hydrolase [Bacteroidota bacterium]